MALGLKIGGLAGAANLLTVGSEWFQFESIFSHTQIAAGNVQLEGLLKWANGVSVDDIDIIQHPEENRNTTKVG